jgi:hypothetical protein
MAVSQQDADKVVRQGEEHLRETNQAQESKEPAVLT